MKYYLQLGDRPENEVTKEEYIAMERVAGFRSKFGPDHVATSAFSAGGVNGCVRYELRDLHDGALHGALRNQV